MSSVGQAVGGVVGAVVGFYTGVGPVYGFQIGAALGGYVDPVQTTIDGQKIGELAVQTSREGVPRAIVFGTSRPIGGNVIATTEPIIVVKREESGGKGGGGSTTVKNEEVYRTYAIRVCEGPITGYRRIWRNGKLIYDATAATATGIDNNNQFLSLATLHLGGYDQMPDPTLQAAFGVDNVVAHRGTAYMVIDNENLTQLGGAIPQYMFEVERCEGFMLTSRPYAVEVLEIMAVEPAVDNAWFIGMPLDFMDIAPGVDAVDLVTTVQVYDIAPEIMDVQPGVDAVDLATTVQVYDIAPDIMDVQPGVDAVVLTTVVITYDVDPEIMDIQPGVDAVLLEAV